MALASTLLAACTNPGAVALSLGTWWQSDSERRALTTLKNSFTASHPEVKFDERSDQNVRTRHYNAQGLVNGAPPDTFQANFGVDLLQWVDPVLDSGGQTQSLGSLLEPVSDLVPPGSVPEEVRNNLMWRGEVYGVPIDIHRVNMLYYNKDRVQPAALALDRLCPESPGALPDINPPVEIECYNTNSSRNEDCNAVAGGDTSRPILALAACQPWVVQNMAFEALVPALLGATDYNALFRPDASADGIGTVSDFDARFGAKLKRVFACMRNLKRYVRLCETRDWSDAAKAVANGHADFTIAGDWAQGEVKNFPSVAPLALPPDLFVFTSDVFPLPKEAAHPEQARELLSTIMTASVQRDFSREKGSIPALSNVVADPNRPQNISEFSADKRLTATSGLFPIEYTPDVATGLQSLLLKSTGDNDEAEDAMLLKPITSGFVMLRKWQRKLEGQ